MAPRPADEAVRALLLEKWRQARDGGVEAFCADVAEQSVCAEDWHAAGGAEQVPRTPPRVVASEAGGGKRWLTVCGTTGTGRAYEGSFVAVLVDGRTVAELPVFWNGRRFSGVFSESEAPTTTSASRAPSPC